MRDSFSKWVGQNLLTILVYVVALAMWGMRLEAKVDTKADGARVEKMAEKIDDIHTLICQDHPVDSVCGDKKARP